MMDSAYCHVLAFTYVIVGRLPVHSVRFIFFPDRLLLNQLGVLYRYTTVTPCMVTHFAIHVEIWSF